VPRAFLEFRDFSSGTKEDGGTPFIREHGSLAVVSVWLGVGGPTPGTHGARHGPHHQGRSSPQDEDLRCTAKSPMFGVGN
jgi:hypothetical protein